MKAAFTSIFRLSLLIIFLNNGSAHNPPQLVLNNGSSQRIVRPGTTVTLNCPVRGNKDTLLFEWYKDKESLMAFAGHRLRVTGSGALRIKETLFDDTGVYTCRAVNGFGSVEYNTTLLVLGEDEDYEHENDFEENEDFPVDLEESTHKMSHLAKPRLIYVTEGEPPIHRITGSTLKLQCVPTGNPRPDVTWYKDGVQVSRVYRRGRWTIHLNNVVDNDAGNYTCVASNVLGSVSYSFIVTVDDSLVNLRGKPFITGSEPSNTTVQEGQMAVMQCTVKCIALPIPSIQWLKQVDKHELDDDGMRNALQMQGEFFRVLTSSEVISKPDGSFYNKLVIEETRSSDSGKYVCLGTNIYGFSFRTAHLFVIPRAQNAASSSVPFPIVVAVTVVVVAALAGVFALLVYCRNHQHSGSRGSSTAVPMVTKDDFLPMHQGAAHVPKCSLAPSRSRHKHHVTTTTVYVPSGDLNEVF